MPEVPTAERTRRRPVLWRWAIAAAVLALALGALADLLSWSSVEHGAGLVAWALAAGGAGLGLASDRARRPAP
ncbi:MAG: hypothetical protein M5U14_13700 [Acidimicrobiia bacterium]|nr:hypothetical protein [Acidimicrobiia bacterium]